MRKRKGRLILGCSLLFLTLACAKIQNKEDRSFHPQSYSGSLGFQFAGTPISYSSADREVPVYPEALVSAYGEQFKLELTGYGTRSIQILMFEIPVFVAASYVAIAVKLSPSDPLQGLEESPADILQLTLLREVAISQMSDGLKEALRKNDVDPEEDLVRPFFRLLNSDLRAGDSIVILSYTNAQGDDEVLVDSSSGPKSAFGKLLGLTLWKVWFGIPVDDKAQSLKTALIGK